MTTPNVSSTFGSSVLHDPALNKGTAFTEEERDALGLRGLLPPRVHTQEEQMLRVLENVRRKSSDLERYIFMIGLQDRNETLFYRTVLEHLEEMMPIIYTPTVGLACQQYGHIFRRPRGLFLTSREAGKLAKILRNWPAKEVQVIVVTDGERILGLGDLGADGMGIPVGKLALYTVCAGVHPSGCLPVTIDVGTNNEDLLKDPLYIGIQQRRMRGAGYDNLIDEFMTATQEVFPHALIQFEDFGNQNAFRFLEKYRNRACTFNDDIQGTAAVALAGLYSALRITRNPLFDQTFLFFGAGEAGTGIAELLVLAMVQAGLSERYARDRCWFHDSKGLVVKNRTDLTEQKIPYAHDHPRVDGLLAAVNTTRPTVLIGVSGQPGAFDKSVLSRMGELNERPIIFGLSNPTSKAECTAEEAYRFTSGRAIFASGSPFAPVFLDGKKFITGQGNNAYAFPGIGLGIVSVQSKLVSDEMFLAVAHTLAAQTSVEDLQLGRIYPPLSRIREVSLAIAIAVAEVAYRSDLAGIPMPDDLPSHIQSQMYDPKYPALKVGLGRGRQQP
jgi:malate dehydrogenase (oxaloacetate-decarboxylating)(NADP+)